MERGDRGFGAGSYSSSGTSDAEDEELKPPGGSSFPSELGSPYQRVCGPRTPESQKRHADAGEKLVRLASQFPHVQGESAADVPSSNVPVFGNIGGVPNAEVRGNSPHDLMRATPSAVGSEMIPPAEEGQAATQLSTVYQSMPSTPVPDAAGDTVFIFDWDDTLFPTWFVSEVVMPCLPPDAKSDSTLPVDSPFAEALAKHARTVRSLLSSARGIGRVGIVTLAQRPWVLSSAQRFLPGIDFKLVLKELDIPIIYARECLRRPMISQAKIEEGVNVFTVAKQAAMLKALKKLYGKKSVDKRDFHRGFHCGARCNHRASMEPWAGF